MPDDARDDEEFKQELHQRVDELSDALHEIASSRKEDSEKERETVMTDGWVPDHLGLLTNHYITLMQVNVNENEIVRANSNETNISGRNRSLPRFSPNAPRLLQVNATADT